MTRTALLLLLCAVTAPSGATGQTVVSLPPEDRPLDDRFELLYEVGADPGVPWAQFQSLSDAAFGPDGTLYLVDGEASRVVAVAPGGTSGRILGGEGDGPGEYRSPAAVAVLPDGTAVVFDARKRAFLRYAPDGTTLEEARPDFSPGFPSSPMWVQGDGSILSLPTTLVTGRFGYAMLTGGGVTSVGDSLPVLRLAVEGGAQTTVAFRIATPGLLDGANSVMRAFVPEPALGLLAEGRVAVLSPVGYEIRIVGPDGSPVRSLTRGLPVRATENRDRDAFRERQGVQRAPRSLGTPGGSGQRRGPPEPWFYPVITPVLSLVTDGGDQLWIQRRSEVDATQGGAVDVVTAEGRYLGTLPAHPRGLPAAFGPDGTVVFLETGAYDVPVARVYRRPSALTHRP